MRLALLLLLLFALAGALLATQPQNLEDVAFVLPFTGDPGLQFVAPRLIVVASTLLLGFALGYFVALPGRIGAAHRARKAEKRLGKVEATEADVRVEAADARAEVAKERAEEAREAEHDARARLDAVETQRLADEVAQRTADEIARRPDLPPVDPI